MTTWERSSEALSISDGGPIRVKTPSGRRTYRLFPPPEWSARLITHSEERRSLESALTKPPPAYSGPDGLRAEVTQPLADRFATYWLPPMGVAVPLPLSAKFPFET